MAQQIGRKVRRLMARINRRVPPGLRSVLGLALIVGGFFGFLPILGFWMIPLGIAIIGLDLRLLWHAIRHRPAGQRRKRSSDLR